MQYKSQRAVTFTVVVKREFNLLIHALYYAYIFANHIAYVLYYGKTYFEKQTIQLEFERLLQQVSQEREIQLQKFRTGLRWADPAIDSGTRGSVFTPPSPWWRRSKRPHSCRCGVSKKGQALLIAVSGVWAAAEEVCDRDRRSHVWEDDDPAEAAGGDDGRCTRSKEWSCR